MKPIDLTSYEGTARLGAILIAATAILMIPGCNPPSSEMDASEPNAESPDANGQQPVSADSAQPNTAEVLAGLGQDPLGVGGAGGIAEPISAVNHPFDLSSSSDPLPIGLTSPTVPSTSSIDLGMGTSPLTSHGMERTPGLPPGASPRPASPRTVTATVLPNCVVSLIDDVNVPAEEAGVLTDMYVVEGDYVTLNKPIAKLDDQIALLQEKAANSRLEVANEEANNDISKRYAIATAKVAAAEVWQAEEANRKVTGTVTQAEYRRRVLKHEEGMLSIENAQAKLRVAALQRNVAGAELDAAKESVVRRKIVAPVSGVVVERYKHEGEWVQTGEPILRIIGLDRLRVKGSVNAAEFAPYEVANRAVTLTVEFERGHIEQFQGGIVFVDPTIQANNEFRVWAEVDNRRVGENWLLGPGHEGNLKIDFTKAAPQRPARTEMPPAEHTMVPATDTTTPDGHAAPALPLVNVQPMGMKAGPPSTGLQSQGTGRVPMFEGHRQVPPAVPPRGVSGFTLDADLPRIPK